MTDDEILELARPGWCGGDIYMFNSAALLEFARKIAAVDRESMMIDDETRAVGRSRIRQFAAAISLAEKRGYPVTDEFLESLYSGIEKSYLEDAKEPQN